MASVRATRYGHEYEAEVTEIKHTRVVLEGDCKNGKRWRSAVRYDGLPTDVLADLLNHPKLTRAFAEKAVEELKMRGEEFEFPYWHPNFSEPHIAANNPTITTKHTDKPEHDEAISEMTLDYNLCLLFGEEPMTESEMAEIMEVSEGVEKSDQVLSLEFEIVQLREAIGNIAREKDGEIRRLRRRIDTLENALVRLVYEKQTSLYGVKWHLVRR